MNKKECPSCAMEIDADRKVCPVCGYEFPKQSKSIQWIVFLLILLFLLYIIFL